MLGQGLERILLENPLLNISFTLVELMKIDKGIMCSSEESGQVVHLRILTYLDYDKGTFYMIVHQPKVEKVKGESKPYEVDTLDKIGF